MKKIKAFLIFFGIADSMYLLLELSNTCPLNGCSSDLMFNDINLPALLGLIWFTSYAFMKDKLLILWQIAAIVGIVFLSLYSFVEAHYCLYCFLAYLAGILLIMLDKTKNAN